MDPNEPGRRMAPTSHLDESIRARLPRAAAPPPVPEVEPPLDETSPRKAIARPSRAFLTRNQISAVLYILTIMVLFFVVVRYVLATELDQATLIYFGLPLLAIGYLAREVLAQVGGSPTEKDR